MPASVPPVPPVVHAPARPGDSAVSSGTAAAPVGDSAPVASVPAGGSSGATVTAVVGGAPAPGGVPSTPVSVPGSTPPTAAVPGAPEGGLARTGADVVLVLVSALLAVRLGTLLVRLGSRPVRPARPC